jgi:hypothetical protein
MLNITAQSVLIYLNIMEIVCIMCLFCVCNEKFSNMNCERYIHVNFFFALSLVRNMYILIFAFHFRPCVYTPYMQHRQSFIDRCMFSKRNFVHSLAEIAENAQFITINISDVERLNVFETRKFTRLPRRNFICKCIV